MIKIKKQKKKNLQNSLLSLRKKKIKLSMMKISKNKIKKEMIRPSTNTIITIKVKVRRKSGKFLKKVRKTLNKCMKVLTTSKTTPSPMSTSTFPTYISIY